MKRLFNNCLTACVSTGSMTDLGDLRVLEALVRDFLVLNDLVLRALKDFKTGARLVCPPALHDLDSIKYRMPKAPVKRKRKSRHSKRSKKVIGTIDGIQDLPQELLDLICDHVTGLRDSKNLRLVAKCFADRAALNVRLLLDVFTLVRDKSSILA